MATDTASYRCRGIGMPQPPEAPPEGYVACARAGHLCPPAVRVTREDDQIVRTDWRCPCCGDMKFSAAWPTAWGIDAEELEDQWRPLL